MTTTSMNRVWARLDGVDAAKAYVQCENHDGKIDFIVLGHSIPHDDKVSMVSHCKELCTCRVLALLRPHESAVPGAEKSVESSDIEAFIAAIEEMAATSASEKRKRQARRSK